jgi:hypothetical protein
MPTSHDRGTLAPLAAACSAAIVALALLQAPVRSAPASTTGAPAPPMPKEWVAKWRSDLAFAADTLPKAHPNLYHSVSRDEFRAALDSLSASLPQRSQSSAVVELGRIMARVGDGHTRLTFPFDTTAGFFTGHATTPTPKIPKLVFRTLPIRLGLFADGLYVVKADSSHRDLLGTHVLRIGELSADSAIAAVTPAIQRDNDAQVRDLLPTWLVVPEILAARGVTPSAERVRIAVAQQLGQREVWLTPIKPGRTPRWLQSPTFGEPRWRDRRPERRYWFDRVPGSAFVYARYREVVDDDGQSIAQFARALFDTLGAREGSRLVLDVRGNVGGNGFLNEPILTGMIRERRLWEPGAMFVITDRGTFSAAAMLVAALETHTPAVFVGEKTGGAPNGYGDSKRVTLPNTGLTIRVSSLYWQTTDPRDVRDGFTPLIPTDTFFADEHDGRDPPLERILAWEHTPARLEGRWSGTLVIHSDRADVRLVLRQDDGAWTATMDSDGFGYKERVLEHVQFVGNELRASWNDGGTWELRARPGRDLLIGTVTTHGNVCPIVLTRQD